MTERVGGEELRQQAYDFGLRDAREEAEWEHSLEQHLWGTVLPDFSLEQKAALLSEYTRGWRDAGGVLPPARGEGVPPEQPRS